MSHVIEHHGDSKRGEYHRLYRIWANMKNRCSSPTCCSYDRYGGRGIKVCDEWSQYTAFKEWAITHGYADNLTIDRINNNGNYEPNNCRWATYSEQNINQRPRAIFEYNGKYYSIRKLAELTDVPRETIYHRIHCLHWGVEEAIHTPINGRIKTKKGSIGEYPFEDYYVHNYLNKKQNCNIVVLYPRDSTKVKQTVMTYARYLMCVKEKRWLTSSEIVRHKDGDTRNDAIENLEIITKS